MHLLLDLKTQQPCTNPPAISDILSSAKRAWSIPKLLLNNFKSYFFSLYLKYSKTGMVKGQRNFPCGYREGSQSHNCNHYPRHRTKAGWECVENSVTAPKINTGGRYIYIFFLISKRDPYLLPKRHLCFQNKVTEEPIAQLYGRISFPCFSPRPNISSPPSSQITRWIGQVTGSGWKCPSWP